MFEAYEVKRTRLIATRVHCTAGRPEAMTMELRVAQNQIRFHQARCSNGLGNSKLLGERHLTTADSVKREFEI